MYILCIFLNNSIGELSNRLNVQGNFVLLGSVSYKSQTTIKDETITLNDSISNYKKVLIGLFDGTNIINPAIFTVSEFENINMGIRVLSNNFQGTITYISDTTCKFSSYNQIASQRDVVLYGIK